MLLGHNKKFRGHYNGDLLMEIELFLFPFMLRNLALGEVFSECFVKLNG